MSVVWLSAGLIFIFLYFNKYTLTYCFHIMRSISFQPKCTLACLQSGFCRYTHSLSHILSAHIVSPGEPLNSSQRQKFLKRSNKRECRKSKAFQLSTFGSSETFPSNHRTESECNDLCSIFFWVFFCIRTLCQILIIYLLEHRFRVRFVVFSCWTIRLSFCVSELNCKTFVIEKIV